MTTNLTCNFQLIDDSECGQSVYDQAKGKCRFHAYVKSSQRFSGGGPEAIKQYVVQNTKPIIDFAGIKFEGHLFTPDQLGKDKPIVFDGGSFQGCTFQQCEFVDVSFKRVQGFSKTYFKKCTFAGVSCTFDDSTFRADMPPFEDCDFVLDNNSKLDTTCVSFKGCLAEVHRSMFQNCYVKADRFTCDGLSIDSSLGYCTMDIAVGKRGHRIRIPVLYLDGVSQIILNSLRFSGKFLYNQLNDDPDFCPKLSATGTNFDLMTSAEFRNANLERVRFQSSLLETVKFQNCKWNTSGGYKKLLEDSEDEASSVHNTEEIMRLYIQLKKNFESAGNFIGAGDWHYREMEARRRLKIKEGVWMSQPLRKYFYAISLYKWVSNYGESYKRPLIWILGVWLLFSCVYFFSGFTISGEYVNYDICTPCDLSFDFVGDAFKALLCSLSAMTLQVGKTVKITETSSILWYIIQLLFTAVLAPLFLLAVRREFRR